MFYFYLKVQEMGFFDVAEGCRPQKKEDSQELYWNQINGRRVTHLDVSFTSN